MPAANEEKACYASGCKEPHESKGNGTCLICRLQFHYTCEGLKGKVTFVCRNCAQIVTNGSNVVSADVQASADKVEANITRLSSIADQFEESYNAKYDDLKTLLDKRTMECMNMQKQINSLRDEVGDLKREMSDLKKSSRQQSDHTCSADTTTPAKQENSHLVLADSILRDVDSKKLNDTTFISTPGLKV
jgi:uncharacterized protein YoxC